MARRITFDMFPGGVDERVLRPGDQCDLKVVDSILGYIGQDIDETEPILQNKNAYSSHYIGDTRLYQTFARDTEDEPYTYRGLCAWGEHGNMHPETASRVFIISQFHADSEKDAHFNDRFARMVARTEFLKHGCIPIVPHLYFPKFMHDFGFERDFGIEAGHLAMRLCDRVVLAVVDGRISDGMRADIDFATMKLGIQPERIDFTKGQAWKFINESEELANAERVRGQH